jgi:hypothetical protein
MFRLGMVEQRPLLAFQERGAVADPPAGDILAAIDKPRIAADETAHLQQPRRPQLRKFAALHGHRIGERQPVREIEPGDVVRDRVGHAVLQR